MLPDVVGHEERGVRVPAVGLLGQADLVDTERRPVRLLAVLLVGRPEPDVRANGDEARAIVRLGGGDGVADGLEVVAIADPLGVPAVGVEAGGHVLAEGHRRRAVELDPVVVVEDDQLAQPEVAGEARRFRR